MKKCLHLIFYLLLLCCWHQQAHSQCVSGSAGGNGNLMNNGGGSYSLACDEGGVSITGTSPVVGANNIQWSNGQTGNFTFTPDCNNLGCQQFTPCIPAGTNVPQQCLTFGALGVPTSGSGNNFSLGFNISGFCYTPGMTYSGDLGITLSGSGDVSLSVVQPDGGVQGPLTFDIGLINDLSPVPLSLLNLDVDPNGDWAINITGGGLTGYNISSNSTICLEPVTTAGIVCGDPIEICVFGGCPSFTSVQASETEICSGGTFTLDATMSPLNPPNVTYNWSGNGINGGNQNSANPSISLTNNTCAPITETYTLNVTCTNDGSPVVNGATVNVTVYPEVDASQVVIDNTTNVTDPGCSIAVSYPPCPGFTIAGNTTFSPGDNGTTIDYVVSSGNDDCAVTVSSLVNCQGDCTPADVTVNTICNGNNYDIEVVVNSLGDSQSFDIVLSDGTVQNVTAAGGTYPFGPYASTSPTNVKVIDANDPGCSLNLGEYGGSCLPCPNLTSINALLGDACSGDVINLVANVDQGVEGTAYSIQWYENGVPIVSATTATYAHTVFASDRCNTSINTYTAELTCLYAGGIVSTTATLSQGPVNVHPVPEAGVDFVFTNCSVAPIDNCGGTLTVNVGGANDPSPGNSTTVNYTITVGSAPASCGATGTETISCPNCTDYPGNGAATETVLCWGESFDFSNTSALVTSLGYEVGYTITPNPPSSYATTADLLNASLFGLNGPFPAPGSIPATEYINDGTYISPSDPCGELLYFTPFLSFTCQSYNAENSSGSIFTPNEDGLTVPGVGGTTLAIPQVPYCPGLVSYDIEVCVEDQSFDTEEPLAESALLGIIGGLPGGVFSSFPNIDDIHDSCDTGFFSCDEECYSQNNWTQNPSGELVSIITVNLIGAGDDQLDWDLRVDVDCNSSFPTICPDCNSIGAPIAVRFLPAPPLSPITPPDAYCEGDPINLFDLNPNSATAAANTYTWYEGPVANGVIVADASAVLPPVGVTEYCVSYAYCETGDCLVEVCTDITVNALPALTSPVLGPICPGESFELTSVEAVVFPGGTGIGGGTFEWSIGGPNGAPLGNATNVTPIGSEQYCVTYTDDGFSATDCSNTICTSFTYNPVPVLLTAAPSICVDSTLQLTDLNPILTTATGTFVWYAGNPATGSAALNNTAVSGIADGTEFWVTFNEPGGCSTTTSIIVTVNPLPVLTAPTATICEGEMLDLTSVEGSVTTSSGTFVWYDNDPTTTGNIIANPTSVMPVSGDTYCVEFTESANSCTDYICFMPTVNALPVYQSFTPNPFCAGSGPYDLTQYEASIAAGNTFEWYDMDPATGATPLASPSSVTAADGSITTFYFVITDPMTNCVNSSTMDLEVYAPVTGAVAFYDCGLNVLRVNLTTATGGSGTGYVVSASSPNTNGDVLPDDAPWTVIIEDSNGCQQAVMSGVNDCNSCKAMAPTVAISGPACGDGSQGAPLVIVDNMDGSTEVGEITEYILTTMPNDTIRLVGTLADMQAAVDGITLDSTVCIQAITYTQAELDQIVSDLDVCTNGLAVSLLGLSLTGNTLEGIIAGIQGFSPGATFTLGTIESLIGGGGGGPGFGGMVDIGELLGLAPGTLICDVPAFCYNISTQTCVTLGNCGCNSAAPSLTITGNDCGNGTASAPFVLTNNGDGSTQAGELTEYILTAAPNDTIRLVGDIAAVTAGLDALPNDSTVCVQAITYTQAELDQIVVDLNTCTNGLATSLLGLSLTGNTLEGIIGGIQGFSPGATFTLGTIESLIGGSNGGPGAGGMVDIGELLGLAPNTLICDIPPFCYSIGAQACVTTGDCCTPMTACDDGDPCTINDMVDANCACVGTFIDADGDGVCDLDDICPGFDDAVDSDNDMIPDGCDTCDGNLVGTTCNDNDACTVNDVYDANCVCAGTFADADNDGVCDADDVCPGFNDNLDADNDMIPDGCDTCDGSLTGLTCDDFDACTVNDVYDANCVCAGTFADADNDGVCDTDDVCPGFDDNADADNDMIPDGCDTCDGNLAGTTCNDNDPCTTNDAFDANCNCVGTFAGAGDCSCTSAPTLTITGSDCGDGTAAPPFALVDNGDGSTGPGQITEYILTTAPNDTIRLVGDLATITASLNTLPTDSTVCIQSITHDQAELDQIVADLDVCTNGLATGALGLAVSGNTLESIITAIVTFAPTAVFTIADIETLIGGSNGGPGLGGSVDVGSLLGLAPGTLVCDILPFCYKISAQTCLTTGSCCGAQACDDNDPCTVNDMIDANCNCVGTFADADNDGVCDANDICPGFNDNLDGDGDMIPDGCDTCDGNLVNTACNDNDPCTINDLYDANCNCIGTFADADADGVCDANDVCPGFNDNLDGDGDMIPDGCDTCSGSLTGLACDDLDPCTINDVYDAACLCAGTLADSDGDGTCDANDLCPGGPEPGSPCDDGDATTMNDAIDGNCNCVGIDNNSCTLEIPLNAGWNLISSYCRPIDPDMEVVFMDIESNTVQVKNLTATYVPAFGFNNIGNWDITSGYQVKMVTDDTLVINGTLVDPLTTPITLNQGWNLISYLLQTPSDPFNIYVDINPNIIQLKNLTGTYIPSFNFNDMGDAKPKNGYQVKMLNSDVLIYDPANQ